MALSTSVSELTASLKETLSKLMLSAHVAEVLVREDLPPLVLLMRGHAVDAFAVGGPEEYEALYSGFKKHYLAQGAEWSTKEVSFILCVPSDIRVDESFCSGVELDVYFCRKYVLQLAADIAESLARLPFLPLERISGASIRPPSAKTLLRQRSVKTDLAAALVEPGTGAGTILVNCLDGKYGEVHPLTDGAASTPPQRGAESRHQALLKSISIQNFRAYRTEKTFELGSAVTVLYGPNGFGKTSFFDALDFAVTGSVGRLANAKGGLAKVAKNLDCGSEPTAVTVKFQQGKNERVLVRKLDSPNDALLDGKLTQRKAVLAALTGGEGPPADRVENLVSLFRATHLFSQDRQELTEDIAADCTLSADLVSRMLAFDDYVNAVKKSTEVFKLAKQRLDEAKSDAQTGRAKVAEDTQELERLKALTSPESTDASLESRLQELESSASELGVEVSASPSPDPRAIRASLEALARAESQRQLSLEFSREKASKLRTLNGQRQDLESQLETARLAVEKGQGDVSQAEQLASAAEEVLSGLKEHQGASQNRRDWLAWAASVQPTYARLKQEEQDFEFRQAGASESAALTRDKLELASAQRGQAAAEFENARQASGQAENARAALQAIQLILPACGQIQGQVQAAQAEVESLQRAYAARSLSSGRASEAVGAQSQRVASLVKQLEAARAEVSSVRGLVAALRSHVSSGTCDLCGHDHGSQEALLVAIDRHADSSAALAAASDALARAREELHALELAEANEKSELTRADEKLRNARAVLSVLIGRESELSSSLSAVGLSISSNLTVEHGNRLSLANLEERRCSVALKAAQEMLEATETQLAAARAAHDAAVAASESVIEARATARKEVDALVSDAARGLIDLDQSLETFQQALASEEKLLAERVSQVAGASQKAKEAQTARAETAARAVAARSAYVDASAASKNLSSDIATLVSALKAAGIAETTPDSELLDQVKLAASRATTALALRDKAAELEVLVDARATSAAFDSIRSRISQAEADISEAESRAAKVSPWVRYFDSVSKLLAAQQAQATTHFTTEYGPRTATIQRRLRPVYGFEDITVTSKNSAIEVHVSRNGEQLRPTDYFSQSQVQTLVLGLFLTACSSQTWSGFSSVMMDDPVSHFDDLNTYALLDLISGLQDSPDGQRQFVISTCDEKLLQLARQKFRYLGDAAKFYRFQAIGSDGPLVSELPL
jgi:exonuclease SbcC